MRAKLPCSKPAIITRLLQFSIVVCCVFVVSLLDHGLHDYFIGYVVTVHEEVVLEFFAEREKTNVTYSFVGEPSRLHILLFNIQN